MLILGLHGQRSGCIEEYREVNMAELLQEAIKKTMFDLPSYVSEGPTEFVYENIVPVNDLLSHIAEIIMGLFFLPKKLND